MKTKTVTILVSAVLALAACGTSLTDSADAIQAPTSTGPVGPTETSGPPTTAATVVETTIPSTATTVAPTTTTTEVEIEGVEVFVYLVGGPDADPDSYDCSLVSPVIRVVQAPATLAAAMEALLAGSTADELAAGYGSWFSPEVGWELESAIISDGVARIDFSEDSPYINNASTSCGSASFLGQLIETATQFETVDNALFSIGGDPTVFYQWLQRDVPEF